jgi:2-hydroxy-4-carboxymuconate semialdehyde hemiacetal dehydrogenase
MKICLAGEGAQGATYMKALQHLPGVQVATLAGGIEADARAFAAHWGIPHYSLDLGSCLRRDGIEAVILASPSQIHATQTATALGMGKHVMVEIPMALSLADCERLAALERRTGLVCMVAHTRRYSAVMRELRRRVVEGELHPHHLVFQTYFFRRENINRFGKPRTWTDDLLWHHGCHIVDHAYWLLGDPDMAVWGQVGPDHPVLGVPMDLTIGMRSKSGCLVSAALSFNHHGPIRTWLRCIGEERTLVVDRARLLDQDDTLILEDEPDGSFGTQCREFFDAIDGRRPAETSVSACLPVMATLDRIAKSIDGNRPRP